MKNWFICIFCVGMLAISLSLTITIKETLTDINRGINRINDGLIEHLSNIDDQLLATREKRTPYFEVHNSTNEGIYIEYAGLFYVYEKEGYRNRYYKPESRGTLDANEYQLFWYPNYIVINGYEIDGSFFSCKSINVTGFDDNGKPIIQKRN